jgi:hypothetical protein
MKFYVGLHQPSDAKQFECACISINRLRGRKKPVGCPDVLLDSGAFTELEQFGEYRHAELDYAAELWRLHCAGVVNIVAAVSQDYMCEPFMLRKTGLSIDAHQWLTIHRYINLTYWLRTLFAGPPPFHLMPVLQGYSPSDYVRHLRMYGDLLPRGAWVGVGSVCKRQGNPSLIIEVLSVILAKRPDLRLHGFGVKKTSLRNVQIREMLHTADSMAWSFAARYEGRSPNDPNEAKQFIRSLYQ